MNATREKLPSKRPGWAYELTLQPDKSIPGSAAQKVTIYLSTFPDGRLAEVFLDHSAKEGTALSTYLGAFARQTSKLLQFKASVRSALSSARGVMLVPGKIDVGIEEVDGTHALSILDAIATVIQSQVDEHGKLKDVPPCGCVRPDDPVGCLAFRAVQTRAAIALDARYCHCDCHTCTNT
jgi:hypothetical protein